MPDELPVSEVVMQDTSVDGSLEITVWVDPQPQTELMKQVGVVAMGILRIYNINSNELVYKERVPLSESTLHGPGPTASEVDYWSNLIAQHIDKP